MKFCIYQINLDRDTDRVAFEDLENLQRYHGGRVIRSDLYDKIYEGDFPCSSLEDLFHIFNVEHPADYPGRSMSVSDVVEIIDSPKLVGVIETEFRVEQFTDFLEYTSAQEALRDQNTDFVAHDYYGLNVPSIEPGFYFCDSIGFKQVIFHPENAGPKENVAAPQNAKTLLKLFMPLTADIVEYNEYGDLDDELSYELDGHALTSYEDKILAALVRERLPEEAERGIMHWYHGEDSVNEKVRSVVFGAEIRNGQLWGVAECLISGELTPEELDTLKNYVRGQASDGWGEGFEQRELRVDDGVMYVHLWNSTFWSIQTEEERFSPTIAEELPERCMTTMPGTGALIWIKRGETGYHPSDWETGDPVKNREKADFSNERWGVTPAQEQAMLCGSMFGWDVPGADPKFYEQNELQMGGM